jgi:predicted XRE-type DNA-binding protein
MKRKSHRSESVIARLVADASLERRDADLCKSYLAREIVKLLDRKGWTAVDAREWTGMAAADFSRIRKAELGRFTIDRLMLILSRLGCQVDVRIIVRRSYRKPSIPPPEDQRAKKRELAKARRKLIERWKRGER